MKIVITIDGGYTDERYLYEKSDIIKNQLLHTLEKFFIKDVDISYEQEFGQIDTATGNIVHDDPYPIERCFNSEKQYKEDS